jgi:hypothetical protein
MEDVSGGRIGGAVNGGRRKRMASLRRCDTPQLLDLPRLFN